MRWWAGRWPESRRCPSYPEGPMRRLAIWVALVLGAGGCTAGEIEPLPVPPSVAVTTSTTVTDLSAVGLPAVPGRTTTTVVLGPGEANLAGSVSGPEGPVAGATVRIERLVGDGIAMVDVGTAPDGAFTVPKVLGGRYRVRAWKAAPDNLALVEPAVFFVEAREAKNLTLPLTRYQGAAVTAAVAPDPPLVDEPANVVVQVVNREVDPTGVVRSTPITDVRLELFGAGDWRVQSANPVIADEAGRGRWQLMCRRVGKQPLSVVVGDSATFSIDLPACTVPPPPPEEVTTTAPTATTTPPTTSPTRTTTTTTRR